MGGSDCRGASKFAIWWPHSFTIIQYLKDKPKGAALAAHHRLHWLAIGSFIVLAAAAYASRRRKKRAMVRP